MGWHVSPLAHHGTGQAEVSGLFSLNRLARPDPLKMGRKRVGLTRFATPNALYIISRKIII